jgi:LAS superfamily LD-carboxypeptidase LdcB
VETPQYENGKIPEEELQDIGEGHQLIKPAAQAFAKMTAALNEAGHSYTLNSAYRTIEEQEQLVEDLGLLEEGGRAAAVGTSEHGLGTAVDLKLDWDAVEWLRAHAAALGFAETIPEEPWHWNYIGE